MTLPGACRRILLFAFFLFLNAPVHPQSFGRFGRVHEDGLLTVNVHPRGFSFPATSINFALKWGDPQAPLSAVVPKIDPTEKQLAVTGGGDGGPNLIRYSLLYPGVSAVFGNRMVLRFETRDGNPLRCGLDATRLKTVGLLLLPGDRFPTTPLLIVPPRRSDVKVWFNGVSLTIESATPLGLIRFATPTGIARVDDLADAWTAAQQIASFPVPERTGAKASVSADGATATLTEGFRGGVAPVSPLLAFAIERGYPAQVEGRLIHTAVLTRWGAFAYVRGSVARVRLPVPPNRARGYVVPAAPDAKRVQQVNALVGRANLGALVCAQHAGPFLTPGNRTALRSAWKAQLTRSLSLKPPLWRVETEPITGESYLWTWRLDGVDGGNALPIYGLATWVRYSGDTALARASLPALRRIRRYFDLADDWVWMTTAGSDDGRSTGIGDRLSATYSAAVACRDLAQAIGDRALADRAAVWAARVAVPTVARLWYTDFARNTGQIGPASLALGYHETEGFTRCVPGKDDPWNATSLLSAGGGLPELAELYARVAPEAVRELEARYETAFPRWFDGGIGYPFATAYKGNSLYVSLPHVYARAVVLGESSGKLWPRVDRALGNRNNGWVAPNILAELIARSSPLHLIGWGNARYDEGVTESDGSAVRLRFVAPKGVLRVEAELAPGVFVSRVTVGGAAVTHAVDERRLSFSAPVPGGVAKVVVEVGAPPVTLPGQADRDKVR